MSDFTVYVTPCRRCGCETPELVADPCWRVRCGNPQCCHYVYGDGDWRALMAWNGDYYEAKIAVLEARIARGDA